MASVDFCLTQPGNSQFYLREWYKIIFLQRTRNFFHKPALFAQFNHLSERIIRCLTCSSHLRELLMKMTNSFSVKAPEIFISRTFFQTFSVTGILFERFMVASVYIVTNRNYGCIKRLSSQLRKSLDKIGSYGCTFRKLYFISSLICDVRLIIWFQWENHGNNYRTGFNVRGGWCPKVSMQMTNPFWMKIPSWFVIQTSVRLGLIPVCHQTAPEIFISCTF